MQHFVAERFLAVWNQDVEGLGAEAGTSCKTGSRVVSLQVSLDCLGLGNGDKDPLGRSFRCDSFGVGV